MQHVRGRPKISVPQIKQCLLYIYNSKTVEIVWESKPLWTLLKDVHIAILLERQCSIEKPPWTLLKDVHTVILIKRQCSTTEKPPWTLFNCWKMFTLGWPLCYQCFYPIVPPPSWSAQCEQTDMKVVTTLVRCYTQPGSNVTAAEIQQVNYNQGTSDWKQLQGLQFRQTYRLATQWELSTWR